MGKDEEDDHNNINKQSGANRGVCIKKSMDWDKAKESVTNMNKDHDNNKCKGKSYIDPEWKCCPPREMKRKANYTGKLILLAALQYEQDR